jgi:hypothetical protein
VPEWAELALDKAEWRELQRIQSAATGSAEVLQRQSEGRGGEEDFCRRVSTSCPHEDWLGCGPRGLLLRAPPSYRQSTGWIMQSSTVDSTTTQMSVAMSSVGVMCALHAATSGSTPTVYAPAAYLMTARATGTLNVVAMRHISSSAGVLH